MKAIYRNKKSGDLFAIETDDKGEVLSTSGPLCFVDFSDFTNFADYWLQTGEGLPSDLDSNGVVDLDDVKIFVLEWLCGCPYNWPLR